MDVFDVYYGSRSRVYQEYAVVQPVIYTLEHFVKRRGRGVITVELFYA